MSAGQPRQYRQRATGVKQEQDEDSDAEEPHLGFRRADGRESQIIHSGHFMVSSPHIEHPPKKGYDFDTVNMQTCQTYHFGKTSTSHLSIDASLTKLFECMTLAYSGKLVSPKWKNFKGLKLLWRDKIRLNNAIWRAWYMQYVERRDNPVCHFVTPLEGSVDAEDHRPAEAIATEGKYWRRRIEIVIREYHKWRTYFKKRLQKHKDEDLSSLLRDEDLATGGRSSRKSRDSPVPMEMELNLDMLMSVSDTLFSTLASHQPVAWPNPREIAHAGNADMIQPGLIPLQPNLDFMDFEPLQDFLQNFRQPVFPSTSPPGNVSQTQAPILSSIPELPTISLDSCLISPPGQIPGTSCLSDQSAPRDPDPSYSPNYMSIFPVEVSPPPPPTPPLPAIGVSKESASSLQDGNVSPPPSVITHTASSVVVPSAAATIFSIGAELPQTRAAPQALNQGQGLPPAVRQATPVTPSLHPAPAFALPRPIAPAVVKKSRHVQRIVPATPLPSPHLIFAPFPGHPSAVIVTPSTIKGDTVPTTGVVISSPNIAQGSGFHILSQTQKSPQLMVPKEETSSNCKTPASCPNTGRDGRSSGQGSPCGSDQASSPQSPLSSTTLPKNNDNQSWRVNHISAEQKRRFNINIGFKTLGSLVPTLKSQSNTSNAATLQRTVEYIGKLQQERQQMLEESRRLKEEIEELNASINLCQEQLPATGVPVTQHRFNHMREKFDDYVRSRTLQNWKFWIFSVIVKPLFESFNGSVSTSSKKELCDTTLQWLERHCALPVLRPMVLGTLRQLCTTTSIMSDPSLLPEEARQAVMKQCASDPASSTHCRGGPL
ncbi:MLX-interacting protein isoform X2 [Denticeps clupeoides]|uniref:MLX-interacting protein isoform X2 n=1 Tax=Denticeps clupeoides TaxID=299321 RepID=UPI0010A3C410|nr:MLX-interacting protein isoform X2 [Denticeps clupeoides]